MFKYLLVFLMSFGAIAQNELYIVNSPDIAQDGWYWEVEGGGWGITLTIQPVNYNDSGYAAQGAIYTYKEDGSPMWYVFQGDYVPNQDVYAWREDRGPLGAIEGLLVESKNGNCIDCEYLPNELSASGKGNVKIEWNDPINAEMTVNGVKKDIKLMYYHSGLNDNSADFITERMFFIHGASSNDYQNSYFDFFKGTAVFSPLTNEVKNTITELSPQGFNFDENLDWYVMKDHALTIARTSSYMPLNVFEDNTDERNISMLLLAYDKQSGLAYLYPGLTTRDQNQTLYSIYSCFDPQNLEPVISAYVGLLRPAVSQTSRFYYNENDVNSQCENPNVSLDWKRQQFIEITSLPTGFDDLSNVPAMLQRPDY